jgi:hypothetical protein
MQIRLKTKKAKIIIKDKWHLWFAWHPVIISQFGLSDTYSNDQGIRIFVWLDFVQRKLEEIHFDRYEDELNFGKYFNKYYYTYMLPQISH